MTRSTVSALRTVAVAAAAAPLALAVTAAPAQAVAGHLARTTAASPFASTARSSVAVTGTDCPDVPSPSFCLYSWASGTGRFAPTGFASRDGKLVVTGLFSGTTSARHQDQAVDSTPATVPVATVSVGRDAVVVTPGTTTFGPYVEGGTPVTTTTVELPALVYPAPGAVFATVAAVTIREGHQVAAFTARNWRRAGGDSAAQAAVLNGLLAD